MRALLLLLLTATLGCTAPREGEDADADGDHGPEELGVPSGFPERLVSMSPNLTQIVFALGADNLLVGVDQYSVYPESAKSIPRMGSYLDPDLEALVAARPDLVLVVETDENIGDLLSGLGLEYEAFGNDTVTDVLASIRELGALLGREDAAEKLLSNFEAARRELEAALSEEPRTRVALVVGRNPGRLQDIYVAGSSSFLGELLTMAGGENVFGDLPLPWPQVGVESIVAADPDVIVDSTLAKGASDEEFSALASDWHALPSLRAVKYGRVIVAREGWFQIPGAYMDSTLRLFAHWLHPDIFPDEVPDPNKSATESPDLKDG